MPTYALRSSGRSVRLLTLAAAVVGVGLAGGCTRSLTIKQDKYINTASQANRPPSSRDGEPLELTIVCVYPADLKKPVNALLRPDSTITSRDWYARRPRRGGAAPADAFELPENQIFVLTNEEGLYGTKIGNALRGAALDLDKPIERSGISFHIGDIHDDNAVMYVFGKFVGVDTKVLPVPPAKFHPPGDYTADLTVEVGVLPNTPLDKAQYIKVLSERKLNKDRHD